MKLNKLPMSICILSYNRCNLLRYLLIELSRLQYQPLEILVVDNHSEDATERMMKEEFSGVVYIRTERNLGAVARNRGMKGAKGEVIITLDDDVRGIKDVDIESLSEMFTRNSVLGAVNFRVVNQDGKTCNWVHHCREEEYYDQEFTTYEITEGAVAFRKKALECSGYYPESFFLSHEGPDLAFRILENGYNVLYSAKVKVEHLFAEESRKPWRNYYYDTRNQLWLAARLFPLSYAVAYLWRGLISMLIYSVRDGYFRYYAKAIRDGLAGMREALKERHVLSKSTMTVIRNIESKRPSAAYSVRKKLFKRGNLLFK
jgi:GT2 family glycosyltransferase